MRGEKRKIYMANVVDNEGEIVFRVRPTRGWYMIITTLFILLILAALLSFLVWRNDTRLDRIEEKGNTVPERKE